MDSIVEKVGRYGVPLTVDSIEKNIKDIAGCRVICSFPEDIYTLANCVLDHDDVTLVEIKDYIKTPKESGYRSLHLIISIPIFLESQRKDMKVEIQFRTIAMDFWASLEHKLRYKKGLPPKLNEKLSKELLECAQISSDLDARMERIRNQIMQASNKQ